MAFNTKFNSIVGVIIVLLLIAGVALVMQRAPEPQRGVMSPETVLVWMVLRLSGGRPSGLN